jgi:hypothetical protein
VNNDAELANILRDLDRCEHGRHAADSCWDCPDGRSAGNPHLAPASTIGYSVYGEPIVMPDVRAGQHTGQVEVWRGRHVPS